MADVSAIPNTAASKLHLLDLTNIKSHMGANWARTAELVERFFEGAICRHLGTGDTFVRQGELSYILLLRDLSFEEAKIKCSAICEDLRERLFGNDIQSASLRSLVACCNIPPTSTSTEALDEFLEREGTETIIQVVPVSNEGAASISDPVKGSGGEVADSPALRFRHRPIWDTSKNVVINYLCQGSGQAESQEDRLGPELAGPEAWQAVVDRGVLLECASNMQAVHRRGFRLVAGVSIALDTISYSRLWTRYSRELQKIPPGVSRDFTFFVTGIDSGIPNIRLAQELPKLSKYARSIFCVLNDRGYVGTRFARTGTHAIGIDLSSGGTESVSAARITELSQQAASASIAAFALGISSKSLMLHALAYGIRYLEGPVIRAAVPEPRYAFSQSLEDVYALG